MFRRRAPRGLQLAGPHSHIQIRILHSGSSSTAKGEGIPETMLCSLLLFCGLLGPCFFVQPQRSLETKTKKPRQKRGVGRPRNKAHQGLLWGALRLKKVSQRVQVGWDIGTTLRPKYIPCTTLRPKYIPDNYMGLFTLFWSQPLWHLWAEVFQRLGQAIRWSHSGAPAVPKVGEGLGPHPAPLNVALLRALGSLWCAIWDI